ncbi:hypothetical protein W97_08926 [Coniosporium apollinis CBS 100218]|uniref:Uncharacterized protein n=1 Tax=Coniosporium apollinis (strain CBS 100218) TaxID=1168221 RepID=R7Z6P4_CONA1|nr:uncharacterized protein W97_08926 [Coniosporium apollinis CBS 100218]EON69674.1 hypothetical protein W97_08926 [Coniosporium apollinis CBS 100218]
MKHLDAITNEVQAGGVAVKPSVHQALCKALAAAYEQPKEPLAATKEEKPNFGAWPFCYTIHGPECVLGRLPGLLCPEKPGPAKMAIPFADLPPVRPIDNWFRSPDRADLPRFIHLGIQHLGPIESGNVANAVFDYVFPPGVRSQDPYLRYVWDFYRDVEEETWIRRADDDEQLLETLFRI